MLAPAAAQEVVEAAQQLILSAEKEQLGSEQDHQVRQLHHNGHISCKGRE